MAVFGITALGAVVQGSAGIGLGLVASPVLLSIDARFAPGPLLFTGLIIGARHIGAEWDHLARPSMRRALIGLPFGAVAAVIVLRVMSPSTLTVLVGVLVSAASFGLLIGFTLHRSSGSDVITGAACAFTSMTAALPGPPLVVGFHDLSPSAMRCTVSLFVACVSAVALGLLLAIGRFGATEAGYLLVMAPGAVVGLVLSRWTRPLLDRVWFRPSVLTISLLGGLVLAVRST